MPVSAQSPVALRLSTLYLPEKSQSNGAGDLSYGLTAFEAGLCDTAGRRSVTWFGCLALGFGAVHTVVHNPDPLEPGDRWWGHLRAEVGTAVRIAGPVWLESRLFDLVAFKRWHFRVRVNGAPENAYQQELFMPGASLGLGLHFDEATRRSRPYTGCCFNLYRAAAHPDHSSHLAATPADLVRWLRLPCAPVLKYPRMFRSGARASLASKRA